MSAPEPIRSHRSLRWVQTLNLDIVVGVVCGALLATSVTGTRPPIVWWLLLPAAAWVVYTLDRLLDARRIGSSARFFRHRFHHRHRVVIWICTICVIGVAATQVAMFLPHGLLFGGALLAIASAVYLMLAQTCRSRWFPKEISAAAIYTVAIWYVPWTLDSEGTGRLVIPLMLHFLAALANLLLYAVFEAGGDRVDDQGSIVAGWGMKHAQRALRLVGLTGTALALAGHLAGPAELRPAILVLWIVLALPLVMARKSSLFLPRNRYRLAGDVAFFLLALPALFGSGAS